MSELDNLIKSMPKAFSYVRFSTPEQAKGDSLRRQLERSKKYADEHGLVLDTSFNLLDRIALSTRSTPPTTLGFGM